jgi:hypothetical protein
MAGANPQHVPQVHVAFAEWRRRDGSGRAVLFVAHDPSAASCTKGDAGAPTGWWCVHETTPRAGGCFSTSRPVVLAMEFKNKFESPPKTNSHRAKPGPRRSRCWRGSSLHLWRCPPSAGSRLELSSAVRVATHQNIRALGSRLPGPRRQLRKRHPRRQYIPLHTSRPRREIQLSR